MIDRGELLQAGEPIEVVLRPASRRVAELVGYLGFVPSGDTVTGIHPERVLAGAFPDRGLVLTGVVAACRPAGAGWEADLQVGEATITCRLPDKPPTPDGEFIVTVLDPPYFDCDLPGAPGAARPQQVHRLFKMASDLGRSEAIKITIFYPGDELLPLAAAQSKA